MKKYQVRIYLLWALMFTAGMVFMIYVFLHDMKAPLLPAAAFFAAAVLLVQILQYLNTRNYMRDLVIRLSELVAVITELREGEVFPELEDTLLSRLQDQVMKLSGILNAQKEMIRQERDEMKALVSDISHQLKTPVAVLKMYGEYLTDEEISPQERKEYAGSMEAALQKLTFFTDSMIKVSRLESGIIRLKQEAAAINETVLGAVMQVHQKARARDIHLELTETCGQVLLKHDKRWTEEAIFNILDNAVKYTEPGGQIRITIERYEAYARIDIADTGMGIPEAEQAKIFQRFYRGSGALHEEGVGIGLYLCRKIILEQDGHIKVSSDENGSVFSIFLRLE